MAQETMPTCRAAGVHAVMVLSRSRTLLFCHLHKRAFVSALRRTGLQPALWGTGLKLTFGQEGEMLRKPMAL